MKKLTIVDLNFCESAIPSDKEVKGGFDVSVSNPTGSFSTSANTSHSSGYFTSYNFDKTTGAFSYVVGYGYSDAVSGAAAGATSNGSFYTSTYAAAST